MSETTQYEDNVSDTIPDELYYDEDYCKKLIENNETITKIRKFLVGVLGFDIDESSCSIIVCQDRSVDFHWRNENGSLLINVMPDGSGDFYAKNNSPEFSIKGDLKMITST